jgi:hypothetical protein
VAAVGCIAVVVAIRRHRNLKKKAAVNATSAGNVRDSLLFIAEFHKYL